VAVFQCALQTITTGARNTARGNDWGGHQPRLTRTANGLFVVYPVTGGFSIARQQTNGSWTVVATATADDMPPSLVAQPDGTLHIFSIISGVGTLWSGLPSGNTLTLTPETIPNFPTSSDNFYAAMGIDASGNLAVVGPYETTAPSGYNWAYRTAAGTWTHGHAVIPYRCCYSYVFPVGGNIAIVDTTDVEWADHGYSVPAGHWSDYVFNELHYNLINVGTGAITVLYNYTEEPTVGFPQPYIGVADAYLDATGYMHVIYMLQDCASTAGVRTTLHLCLSAAGVVQYNTGLSLATGLFYGRIVQHGDGHFYLLVWSGLNSSGTTSILYDLGLDGNQTPTPVATMNLATNNLGYSGFFVSVQRGGGFLTNTIDAAFPTGDFASLLYIEAIITQAAGWIKNAAGGKLATLANQVTINNVAEVHPTFVSAEVGTVNATTVAVTFSEAVAAVGSDYLTGVTIKVNTVAATISSATRQANQAVVYYVLASAVVYGDTITWEYVAA
jgi:hypothetical protein